MYWYEFYGQIVISATCLCLLIKALWKESSLLFEEFRGAQKRIRENNYERNS